MSTKIGPREQQLRALREARYTKKSVAKQSKRKPAIGRKPRKGKP
jgi:hypothetical protein